MTEFFLIEKRKEPGPRKQSVTVAWLLDDMFVGVRPVHSCGVCTQTGFCFQLGIRIGKKEGQGAAERVEQTFMLTRGLLESKQLCSEKVPVDQA